MHPSLCVCTYIIFFFFFFICLFLFPFTGSRDPRSSCLCIVYVVETLPENDVYLGASF